MSQSGQQHPKADSGGQRPADPKKAGHQGQAGQGSTKNAVDASKGAGAGARKDAKK